MVVVMVVLVVVVDVVVAAVFGLLLLEESLQLGPVDDVQVVRDRLARPRHRATQWRQLRHVDDRSDVFFKGKQSKKSRIQCRRSFV